jgi:hypothetical protein
VGATFNGTTFKEIFMPTYEDIEGLFRVVERSFFRQTLGYHYVPYDNFTQMGNLIEVTINLDTMIHVNDEPTPREKVEELHMALTSKGIMTRMVDYDAKIVLDDDIQRAQKVIVYLKKDEKTKKFLSDILDDNEGKKVIRVLVNNDKESLPLLNQMLASGQGTKVGKIVSQNMKRAWRDLLCFVSPNRAKSIFRRGVEAAIAGVK